MNIILYSSYCIHSNCTKAAFVGWPCPVIWFVAVVFFPHSFSCSFILCVFCFVCINVALWCFCFCSLWIYFCCTAAQTWMYIVSFYSVLWIWLKYQWTYLTWFENTRNTSFGSISEQHPLRQLNLKHKYSKSNHYSCWLVNFIAVTYLYIVFIYTSLPLLCI